MQTILYCSAECIGYAGLEQAWKYMTICCISFHPCRRIRKQFDHVIKMVRVNLVSSFEQIWQYLSTRYCIPSFKVFTIYGPGSHLGHVTRNIWTIFYSNIPWRPYMNWLQTALCFFCFFFLLLFYFRERTLKMLNLSDLGRRLVNDTDLGLS